jgi:flotillin
MEADNAYLNQVVQEQAQVEQELRHNKAKAAQSPSIPADRARAVGAPLKSKNGVVALGDDFEMSAGPSAAPLNYRITGVWRWKTVIVPPNMHVVHTRRGHDEPLHIGLGTSFRYDPETDAFLVIPAAVQTLLINARCISAERQGILVQAYVQWIVADVAAAYRKLDFSDPHDPMRIVNVQLREQAEAAIKDKVATMAIDAILSDKQPIIEELTHRLRAVAEGDREGESDAGGLGLKIVTVQIKEAVVSSTRLWQNLQIPFRAERERLARLAELESQRQVSDRERTNRQDRESAELDYARRLDQAKAEQARETYDRTQTESERRLRVEQEAEQRATLQRTATERAQREAELELTLQRLEIEGRRHLAELESLRRRQELDLAEAGATEARTQAEIRVGDLSHRAEADRAARDVELLRTRRAVENDVSDGYLRDRLIARLAEVAAALPKPTELRTVTIDGPGGANPLLGFLVSLLNVAETLKPTPPTRATGTGP